MRKRVRLVKAFVVDRRRWLRGEGTKESYLLRKGDGKMCCVGMYARACGVPEAELIGAGALEELNWFGKKDRVRKGLWAAYLVNDLLELEEGERERELKEIFGRIGVRVTFRN